MKKGSQGSRKRKANAYDEIELEILKQLSSCNDKEGDEDILFGQSIAASLKKLDPQKRHLLR